MISSINNRYTKQGLWSLFLMCAFPQHLWTLILVFRDMSWIIERTNLWDAIGNASYAMVYAFVESMVIFCVVALLGLVTPKRWEVDRRVAFLSLLVLITAIWAMIGQLLFIWDISLPPLLMQLVVQSDHPLRVLYMISLVLVIPTVALPVLLFVRSQKTLAVVKDLMERLSLLSVAYLFFDLAGLIIVLIRNLS